MKVPQHLIDEATRRGIVPGAVVSVVHTDGITATVMPFDEWEMYGENLNAGREGYSRWNVMQRGEWSIDITPAPSQGLEEGMATECSPAMRAAIIERAKELGHELHYEIENYSPQPFLWWYDDKLCHRTTDKNRRIPNHEFLARLEATAKKPKPIKIGEHNVDFIANGDVKVGCTRVDYATLKEVYERATKNTNQ